MTVSKFGTPFFFTVTDPASGSVESVEVVTGYAQMGCSLKVEHRGNAAEIWLGPAQIDALIAGLQAARKFV